MESPPETSSPAVVGGAGGTDNAGAKSGDSVPQNATPTNALDAIVSRTEHAETNRVAENLTLREMLERIRTGTYASQVSHVQAVLDQYGKGDEYRDAKKKLPAFIAAGTFTKRNNVSLLQHSGVVGFDLDNVADLDAAREAAKLSPHVAYIFVSPSRIGLKIGLRVKPCADDAEHKRAWQAGAEHLREVMGTEVSVDKGCKDVSRLCFVGNDPDLYVNESASELDVAEPEPVSHHDEPTAESDSDPDELGILSDGIERQTDPGDVDKARAALVRLGPARVDDYDSWINVGMVCKAAGVPFADWDAWSRKSVKYDGAVCREKWDTFPTDSKLNVGLLIRWARLDNGEPPNMSEAGAVEGTELWFARTMAIQHSHNLKHVWPWRSWVAWDAAAGHWRKDESGVAWQAAKITLQKMVKCAVAAAGTESGKEALGRASKFMKKNALENALKLAASEPNVVALPSAWDSHPYLLNCANGTVDLRDGRLREHRREDHLTKSTGIDAGGDAPLWRAFLERIVPDADVRSYLQRAVGYSAIGSVTEHVLHIAWGGGANGKSVFFNAITHALGDYAEPVPGTLLVSDGAREHPTAKASLHGVRFALASESEEDGRIRPAQLKQLTGGDELLARRMREDFWRFKPSHTLWLQTNHKPLANDATHGFWRRVRLIPFTVTIPPEEQDKHLTDELREEAGGILRWIIEGAQQYLTDGLEPPEAIAAATAEYQHEEDELAEFVECVGLVADESAFMPTKELYAIYEKWADGGAFKPWKPRTFSRKLGARYTDHKREGVRGFRVRHK